MNTRLFDPGKDLLFMRDALKHAEDALDAGEFPVGCVIADGARVVAKGRRRHSDRKNQNELDHAEILALRDLWEKGLFPDASSFTIYTTLEPCLMCFGAILISGIRRIVYAYEDALGGASKCDLSGLTPLYRSADVEIIPGVLRNESLSLFYRFFSNPATTYLQETILALYTLEQAEKAGI